MLSEICKELNNWFDKERLFGKFTISNGQLRNVSMLDGQYYRIVGSVLNDGIYRNGDTEVPLKDETFNGAVWLLAVPQDVIKLDEEITAWVNNFGNAANSPFQSESFGGYSYSKASGSNGSDGSNGATWQSIFGSRLNNWRKLGCC